ncbi:DUF6282 family protein [Priestia aryabhattai]|uniref:DUF6282 family protein n=1 Tax=Priestia aryabhattai TaxID=412384 RepID=UPI00088D693E|nr:hypothetical protein SAMN04487777_11220 [Priestia aryabhattai B8W22]
MTQINLNGIIDLHIHSAPDIRPRSHNDIELAQQAKNAGARAFVIKSHHVPTMDRAWLLSQMFPEVSVFGSLTLNLAVGGINPYAVEVALHHGAKIVWLPTIHSTNHRHKEGKSGGIETVKDKRVIPELQNVLKLIADNKAILGTGHLSPSEIFTVVEEAKKHGVKKIVVTHPEFHIVGMSLKEQKKIVEDYDVYLERTYAQPIGGGKYQLNLNTNLEAVQEIGYQSTIISTDSGQIQNPPWNQALAQYIQYFVDHNVPTEALDVMTKTNAAKLLDL